MKIVGLMLVRNEDWVLGASLDAALGWCNEVFVLLDRCTDKTAAIVRKHGVPYEEVEEGSHWEEMDLRQRTLEQGRKLGGTHFAIIDADEILTHNFVPDIREAFKALHPGECLDVPMIPVHGDLATQRLDEPWASAWLTLGFADAPYLGWRAAGDGYQHHARRPAAAKGDSKRFGKRGTGGVMHLQFANQRRLLAKHVLYRMVDHLRWPERETPVQLNRKYDQAISTPAKTAPIPPEWWGDYLATRIKLDGVPYQEYEVASLLERHGRDAFSGLDLKGW